MPEAGRPSWSGDDADGVAVEPGERRHGRAAVAAVLEDRPGVGLRPSRRNATRRTVRPHARDGTETGRRDGTIERLSTTRSPTRVRRHVRRAELFERADAATAARALDQAHERDPQRVRRALGPHLFLVDRGVARPAANGEVVAADYDAPPVDEARAADEGRGREVLEGVVGAVTRRPGDRASRVKALTPSDIARRLERRLPLLTGGARDVPQRQRTLRATIERSHDLLTRDEQWLFARLAVFAGGWRTQGTL